MITAEGASRWDGLPLTGQLIPSAAAIAALLYTRSGVRREGLLPLALLV